MTHFNKETLLIDEANNKILVTAFTNGLQFGEFLFSIYKNDPNMMANTLYKAMKYMNTEDAMIAQGGKPRKRERQNDPRLDKGRKLAQMSNWRDNRRSKPLPGRAVVNFTPLNTTLDQVLMQIRDDATLT